MINLTFLNSSGSVAGIAHLKSFLHHLPVNQTPKGIDIVGAAVLVIEVVGMFPHIAGKQWL